MSSRKMRWPLVAGTAVILVGAPTAGATHLGVFQVGHTVGANATSGGSGAIDAPLFQGLNSSGGNNAVGLFGQHSSTSGTGPGVRGETRSTAQSATGVLGRVASTTPGVSSAAVRGINIGNGSAGAGVVGLHLGTGQGVLGTSQGVGVRGMNSGGPGGFGVWGSHAGANAGVRGTSSTGRGVWATSIAGTGVYAEHTATTGSAPAVEGVTSSADAHSAGVWGRATSGGPGTIGVRGEGGIGGRFEGSGFDGVQGMAGPTAPHDAAGVFGTHSGGGYAGLFLGRVDITGPLRVHSDLHVVGTKNFRIDHPLDPEGRYLQHAALESDAPLNVYSGTATTDRRGFATVRLPAYVEAVTKDFRYQLTLVGKDAWGAQAVVWEELRDGRFTIRSRPGVKVSWEVSGERHDRHLRAHPFEAEVEKTGEERGTYLEPDLYGQSRARAALDVRRRAGASGHRP